MDVQFSVAIEAGIDAIPRGVRAEPGQRDAGRLLHHIAELPGDGQLAAPGHPRRFDDQYVSAHRRPRQPDRHAGLLRAVFHLFVKMPWGTEEFDDDLRRPRDGWVLAL